MILLPTFHWTAVPLIADLPGRPVLGSTRARALRLLGEPLSTSAMARGLGINIGSASVHATALRAAGLVTSVRDGREVLHTRTPLGSLLAGSHQP